MELVCKKCGTVNKDKSIICMRCGSTLDTDKVTEYINIKGKTVSGISIILPFIIIYTAYLVLSIVLFAPYLNNLLFNFRSSFIFEFYNLPILTEFIINGIYIATLFIINLMVVMLTLELISTKKLIELKRVKKCYIVMWGYLITASLLITAIKYKFDLSFLLKHLISILPILPYIKRKCLKICIR